MFWKKSAPKNRAEKAFFLAPGSGRFIADRI
jgi:hypothetical protein